MSHRTGYARAATVLTLSRVVLAVPLALVTDRRTALALLLLAGATDALDGPCARRGGTAGPAGARLDSAADAVLMAAVLVLLARWLGDDLGVYLPWVGAVLAIRVGALAVGRARFGRWGSVHTWANKAAGVAALGAPVLVLVGHPAGLWAVLALAAASACEELVLQATAPTLDLERRGGLGLVRVPRRSPVPAPATRTSVGPLRSDRPDGRRRPPRAP